jgi:serine protease Do
LLVVPGHVLLRDAQRLQARGPAPAVDLGIEVQSLTPSLAAVTRATSGVVVAHPGRHDGLQTGDVVEAMGGMPIRSVRDWRVRVARLDPAATVMLDVVRGGERRSVTLSANLSANPSAAVPAAPSATASSATASATPSAQQAPARALGLTMQAVSRVGSEVILVDADSVAALAGVRPGDVILSVGDIGAPSPAQVTRAFDTRDGPVLAGIRRGTGHRVVVLD